MKSKTKKVVGGLAGTTVVIGSLVLLHKSGKVEHLGTIVEKGKAVAARGTKVVRNVSSKAKRPKPASVVLTKPKSPMEM